MKVALHLVKTGGKIYGIARYTLQENSATQKFKFICDGLEILEINGAKDLAEFKT